MGLIFTCMGGTILPGTIIEVLGCSVILISSEAPSCLLALLAA